MPSFRSAFFFVAFAFVAFTSAAPPQVANAEADIRPLSAELGPDAGILSLLNVDLDAPIATGQIDADVDADVETGVHVAHDRPLEADGDVKANHLIARRESLAAQLAALATKADALVKEIDTTIASATDDEMKQDELNISGVPDVVKVCRTVFTFMSKLLSLIGKGDSKVAQFTQDTIDAIEAWQDANTA